MIAINNNEIIDVWLGDQQLSYVYLGNDLVFPRSRSQMYKITLYRDAGIASTYQSTYYLTYGTVVDINAIVNPGEIWTGWEDERYRLYSMNQLTTVTVTGHVNLWATTYKRTDDKCKVTIQTNDPNINIPTPVTYVRPGTTVTIKCESI